MLLTAFLSLASSGTDSVLRPARISDLYVPKSCARKAASGDFVSIHYNASIHKTSLKGVRGKKFGGSKLDGSPLSLQLGNTTYVPEGVDAGIVGMCVGQKVAMVVPPDLGFGDHIARFPAYDVPASSTLFYEVELLSISESQIPMEIPNLFTQMDTSGDGKLSKDEVKAHFAAQGRSGLPEGLWKKLDTNEDGMVDWHEFDGPKGHYPPGENMFAKMDVSPADGVITREEMASFISHGKSTSVDKIPTGVFDKLDANGDGLVDWGEFDGPKGAHPPKEEL